MSLPPLNDGDHIEVQHKPWRGRYVRSDGPCGFIAIEDGRADGIYTSWSMDAVESVTVISEPLPTEPGSLVSAIVTYGAVSERAVLIRSDVDSWVGARVGGCAVHGDDALSHWRLMRAVEVTPEDDAPPIRWLQGMHARLVRHRSQDISLTGVAIGTVVRVATWPETDGSIAVDIGQTRHWTHISCLEPVE